MHIPDGFVSLPVSLTAGAAAATGVGIAARRAGQASRQHHLPIAGVTAAFVFVVQMLNFPVAAGTSGHVIGGALAAILLGPRLALVVLSVVVGVQALVFADGGLTALGLNVVNLAFVTVGVGWLAFRALTAILPSRSSSLVAAAGIASWASVVGAAACFAGEYSLGGTGGANPTTVFGAVVGVHALIGIGEGLATAAVVAAVISARPDLVWAARVMGIQRAERVTMRRRPAFAFASVGFAAALFLLLVVAPHASRQPDGLMKVASETGMGAVP